MPLGRLHRGHAGPGVSGSPGVAGSPGVKESAAAAQAAEHDAEQQAAAAAAKAISASPGIPELEMAPDGALVCPFVHRPFARQTDQVYGVYPQFPRHDAHVAAAVAAKTISARPGIPQLEKAPDEA